MRTTCMGQHCRPSWIQKLWSSVIWDFLGMEDLMGTWEGTWVFGEELSRSDPWQTKFNLLCQDICNIKANKYVSIHQTNNRYNYTTSSASNKDKHPPMGKHARGGQDGIYYEGNRTEHPLPNTLDTPTHYDLTRCDASQVPL